MDYEQRHKEVLDAIKKLQEANPSDDGIQNWVNENFPELAESEDEKIRKELIEKVKETPACIGFNDKNAVLTWLEKQAEQKSIMNVPSREVILSIWDLGNEWKELTNGCISTEHGTQLNYIQKHWNESEYYLREKQADDKPELKFNVGDWVVNKLGVAWHIDSFDKKNYQVTGRKGNHNYFPIAKQDEMRHWTIADAKPGDVLYFSDETIVIFKDLYNATTFHSYCHIEDGIFNISKDDMPDWWEAEGFKPATKEQCGVLFQKMKESGYEWNNEKKELLEIEEELTDFEKSLKHIMIETLECGDTRNLKADAEMLLRLAQEPKEWSEEDEDDLNNIIWLCNNCIRKCELTWTPSQATRIKSLIERIKNIVFVQPKQQWSEEDEKKIDRAIWLIDHYATHGHDKKLREDVISGLESLKRK